MTTSRKLSDDEKSAFQKKEDTKKQQKNKNKNKTKQNKKKKKKTPQLKKQLHKSSKCKIQTLSLSLSLSLSLTHTHTHTLITPDRPLVQTHQRSAFSAGCVKRAIKVYTKQLATTRCTSECTWSAARRGLP